ncbi:Mg(2+)-transport-ATPase-associated protein MgtC [hydrothermal vent metagenome]|uniref:Mg(2+)-transport-ATPase-associated protein MgtC n=1 Tax=hydrothermal vent metagenome TaxID=652676 RepID=A0A3B1A412_9ZZZZ
MENELVVTTVRLLLAALAGGLIGLERSHHGRPAGFRTHTLVCVSAALLMVLGVFQWDLVLHAPIETIRVDPTRMAQGIMTGIGFLGAGVIFKERLSVRGLTTAASIWITASIGVVIGMGLYYAGFLATMITLGVLSLFRWVERVIPSVHYGQLVVRFRRHEIMPEDDLRALISEHTINSAKLSYQLDREGKIFQYQMTIDAIDTTNFKRLTETLTNMENVLEFTLVPTGD